MMKPSEKAKLFRQLHLLLSTGTNLASALELLLRSGFGELTHALQRITQDLHEGSTLSAALGRYPEVFSSNVIGMIRMGEKTGRLVVALDRCAGNYEWQHRQTQRLKAKLTYPCLVFVMSILGLLGLLVFVLPNLLGLIESLPGQRSAFTGLLLHAARIVSSPWFYLTVIEAVVLSIWGLYSWLQEGREGRESLDRLLLELPYLSHLVRTSYTAQICDVLAHSLACGCPILKGLELARDSVSNVCYKQALTRIGRGLTEGLTVSQAVAREGADFVSPFGPLLAVGEQASSLETVLLKAGAILESDLEHELQTLNDLIEPALMFFLGGVVGAVVILFFYPLSQALQAL